VAAELSHADGQKDMTRLIPAFRNFASTPYTDSTCLDGLHHAAAAGDGDCDLGIINYRGEDTGFKCLWLSSNGLCLNAHGQ